MPSRASRWLSDEISLDRVVVVVGRAKVWSTAECAEDVTNVVGRVDTLSEGGVPSRNNTADNFSSGEVDILKSWLERTLNRVKQVVGG